MLNERYMRDIADTLPEDTPEQVIDPDMRALHATLKLRVSDLQRRRDQAFNEHGIVLPQDGIDMLNVRLTLLIQHGLGINTEERWRFELEWVKVYSGNIEHALSEYMARKKAKHLQMPDGTIHEIREAIAQDRKEETGG